MIGSNFGEDTKHLFDNRQNLVYKWRIHKNRPSGLSLS
jgi:hypothetical protein